MAVKYDSVLKKLREQDEGTSTGTNTGDETVVTIGTLINTTAEAIVPTLESGTSVPLTENDVLRKMSWTNFTATLRKKRVESQASSATITPETTAYDIYVRTAQAVNLTINNHSTSTPNVGDMQQFIITDDGVAPAKTIGYGDKYVDASGLTRPTVLISGKCTKLLYEWRLISGTGKWDLVALNQEA